MAKINQVLSFFQVSSNMMKTITLMIIVVVTAASAAVAPFEERTAVVPFEERTAVTAAAEAVTAFEEQFLNYELQPQERTADPDYCATAEFVGDISGTVNFREFWNGMYLDGRITGLESGAHGFHIHENAITDDDCSSAGQHFNPSGTDHGGPKTDPSHAGDLGNISQNDKAYALVRIFTTKVTLKPGEENNIFGKSVVIHADADNLGPEDPTGNAGDGIACATIVAC